MNIIGHKSIFLSVSGFLALAGVIVIAVFGFKPGIDFAGGTLWQVAFPDGGILKDELSGFLETDLGVSGAVVSEGEGNSFLIRASEIGESSHQNHLLSLQAKFGKIDELSFQTIGSAVGGELRRRAITAFVLVLLAISFYIAFAFRKVSRPVASWKYGLITLITLFHDALIPAGLMAVLGRTVNAEIDTNFIVAILVVMGFSVHDTIVVFDRVRENLRVAGSSVKDFSALVNASINQTIARSVNTSLTLVLVLLALLAFGPAHLMYFVLIITVGTIVGTYSSIFVASPLLTLWRSKF